MRVPQTGETLGRYRLDRVIGQGGMAVVFAATDLRLDRTVALKVITGAFAESAEFRQRFHAEAAALAQLDSPYVTPIHDHDEVDGVLFIVTQYVEGTDLDTLLRTDAPLAPAQALGLVTQVCRGLGDAHRRGIVHRDVKPSNVLVRDPRTPEAHAYLCDFGVARSEHAQGGQLTTPGTITGTWAFLAPECLRGEPATPASDIYALGCLLWACFTGSVPYPGTDAESALAHMYAPVPQLSAIDDLTVDLNTLLRQLLAKDPADRPRDTGAVRTELERLSGRAGGVPLIPPPPPGALRADPPTSKRAATTLPRPASATARRRSRPLVPILATLVVLVLIAGGAAWALLRGDGAAQADEKRDGGSARDEAIAGDLDGDGYGDVLVHQQRPEFGSSPLSVWSISSSGKTLDEAPVRAPAEEGNPLLGDVDGDGIPEVVWVDDPDDVLTVEVVPAEGEAWTPEVPLDPEIEVGSSAMLGDVTGDGKADLILPGGDSAFVKDSIYVAVSEGDGFAEPELWWQEELRPDEREAIASTYLFAGDFDGNGRSDVLTFTDLVDDGDSQVRLLTSEDGKLVPGRQAPLESVLYNPFMASWEIGDVDGDGADEVVIVRAGRQSIDVFEVTADGFGEPVPWRTWDLDPDRARKQVGGDGNESWTLSDVDGDGDADLIALREAKQEEMELRVRLSDQKAFGDPETWGLFPCDRECEDNYYFVD